MASVQDLEKCSAGRGASLLGMLPKVFEELKVKQSVQ